MTRHRTGGLVVGPHARGRGTSARPLGLRGSDWAGVAGPGADASRPAMVRTPCGPPRLAAFVAYESTNSARGSGCQGAVAIDGAGAGDGMGLRARVGSARRVANKVTLDAPELARVTKPLWGTGFVAFAPRAVASVTLSAGPQRRTPPRGPGALARGPGALTGRTPEPGPLASRGRSRAGAARGPPPRPPRPPPPPRPRPPRPPSTAAARHPRPAAAHARPHPSVFASVTKRAHCAQ
jgi:hypothetical protein